VSGCEGTNGADDEPCCSRCVWNNGGFIGWRAAYLRTSAHPKAPPTHVCSRSRNSIPDSFWLTTAGREFPAIKTKNTDKIGSIHRQSKDTSITKNPEVRKSGAGGKEEFRNHKKRARAGARRCTGPHDLETFIINFYVRSEEKVASFFTSADGASLNFPHHELSRRVRVC
jgi:hypothetical protein